MARDVTNLEERIVQLEIALSEYVMMYGFTVAARICMVGPQSKGKNIACSLVRPYQAHDIGSAVPANQNRLEFSPMPPS